MRFQPIALSQNQDQPHRNGLKRVLSNFKTDFVLFVSGFMSEVD